MYDLVVIGAGSGGLTVAAAGAKVGAKVALIEKNQLGGEGSIAACVPSKGLVQAAKVAHQAHAGRPGWRAPAGPPQIDFTVVMSHVRSVVADIARGESEEALAPQGIDVYRGSASFIAYDTVQVDEADRIPATGS